MPSVYKVGMTTGSVKQRIQELTTTGVPKPFQAEKIFEIPLVNLRAVEQLAHKKLKKKDLHHGKEFFEGSLQDCVIAVEDAIHQITRSDSVDLIGQAKLRAHEQEQRRIQELKKREIDRQNQIELDKKINDKNLEIHQYRRNYIEELKSTEKNNESFIDTYFFMPLGLLIFVFIGFALMSTAGPLAWIGVPIFAWWIYRKDKNHNDERYLSAAVAKFPTVTKDTLDNYQKTFVNDRVIPVSDIQFSSSTSKQYNRPVVNAKNLNQLAIEKRAAAINNFDEIDSSEWIVNSSRSILYNIKTKEILSIKSGLGFSIADKYFVLNNLSKPRKIRIEATMIDDQKIKKITSDLLNNQVMGDRF